MSITSDHDKDYINDMKIEHVYPSQDDDEFQKKIYEKREFYYNRIPERPNFKDYNDIKEYRDKICGSNISSTRPHQAMLANFINPNTPYRGILLFHGLGTGKTCVAISIAENFKEQVKKYGTKIYVLVPGPNTKENFKKEIVNPKCTGETYRRMETTDIIKHKADKDLIQRQALTIAMQYYKIMTFKGFYKRVLGEKIKDKVVYKSGESGEKIKAVFKKTQEGEFERDLVIDKIVNLDNSILIVDEAHGLTGNNYGEALKMIIKNSVNLRIVLLTATPMKNLGDDIIDLLNYIRPLNSQIQRDKVFTSDKIHELKLKDNGLEYLKNMVRGYVSHIRGSDPLTYAIRVDKGVIPKELKFTKLTRCYMSNFQRKVYDIVINDEKDDALSSKSTSVSNFAFPILNNKNEIEGSYGRQGINIIKNQLTVKADILNKKIKNFFPKSNDTDFLYLNENGNLTGKIFNIKYLKMFSSKYYKTFKKINRLVWGKKGPKTAFIYAKLVVVGIELFQQILLQNGYLEYNPNGMYNINPDTVCYFCGKRYDQHSQKRKIENDTESESESESESETESETESKMNKKNNEIILRSPSSTDYEKYEEYYNKEAPTHIFNPATFLTVVGGSGEDEAVENIPEEKQAIINETFNSIENKNGKYIKLILGSKVMNEGISLFNIGEVHILNVSFTLGSVDQTVGRGIRWCSHYQQMTEKNVYPFVNVYKYVVTLGGDKLSSEEELYLKAENKYILIKKIERGLKEVAVDCPLNMAGNMFAEEIEKHKNCKGFSCPSQCDFSKCNYFCDDKILNNKYYDPERNIYKMISRENIDNSTFINSLARNEINMIKSLIKDLYIKLHVYTLKQILRYVKKQYTKNDKKDMFDDFFVYKALDELIPITRNDLNNYKDTIIDKFNRKGYLIYINKYYIFQPYDLPEEVPMFYRTTYDTDFTNKLSLFNFIKNTPKYLEYKNKQNIKTSDDGFIEKEISYYDFESVLSYYEKRNEFKYVGIIDKELNRGKSKNVSDAKDVFKIRKKRKDLFDKKREIGAPTIMGSVCTFKEKNYIIKVAKELGITLSKKNNTKGSICDQIRDKMLELEKNNTEGITYVIIPANHEKYPFPYNLKDRIEYIKSTFNNAKISGKTITIPNKNLDNDKLNILKKYNATLNKDIYIIKIE